MNDPGMSEQARAETEGAVQHALADQPSHLSISSGVALRITGPMTCFPDGPWPMDVPKLTLTPAARDLFRMA